LIIPTKELSLKNFAEIFFSKKSREIFLVYYQYNRTTLEMHMFKKMNTGLAQREAEKPTRSSTPTGSDAALGNEVQSDNRRDDRRDDRGDDRSDNSNSGNSDSQSDKEEGAGATVPSTEVEVETVSNPEAAPMASSEVKVEAEETISTACSPDQIPADQLSPDSTSPDSTSSPDQVPQQDLPQHTRVVSNATSNSSCPPRSIVDWNDIIMESGRSGGSNTNSKANSDSQGGMANSDSQDVCINSQGSDGQDGDNEHCEQGEKRANVKLNSNSCSSDGLEIMVDNCAAEIAATAGQPQEDGEEEKFKSDYYDSLRRLTNDQIIMIH
jgi:hypothetical protein